ncbi:PAS domain-containing protein [Streptomyces triticagri]|uniref:PAS domain-containing protein n=1 Tax=Streptomyces triticagri TaxID=2293568 RepID=A0A372LW66_9ACTN|nr:PAS domain-containing protein [Streptomyces triticagri]RFU82891.1 PAS domain-containing protein [Streptomyces triticagri]
MSSRPSRGAARLAAILDALPDALLLVNANGTVVNANTIALETFETRGWALVGRGLLDLLPEFDSRLIPGSMRRPDASDGRGQTKPRRMTARRTDGSEFPVEVTSANLEDGRDAYESHGYSGDELLMLVVRDLSGTVDTEAELVRSQRQTEMILRAAAEGLVGTDTEGRVVLVNPAAAQILGYRASDLGGKELHPLVQHSRPDGEPFPYEESALADTLRSGRKHRVRGQTLWAKDGSPVPVDLTTAPVRDGDQLVGAVLAFTDRTSYDKLVARHGKETEEAERRYATLAEESEERYATLAEEAKERYAALAEREQDRYEALAEQEAARYEALSVRHAQLLAVLGDSLRGPLDQLRGELGALAADPAGQLWPEANQMLHHLSAGYARMTTLVDNVLAYQLLDSGAEKLHREPVLLDQVVAAGVDGAVELIGPGRAQFAVHAPAIEAEVDAARLATALAHLIADVAGIDATGNTRAPAAAAPGGFLDSTVVVAAAQRGEVVRIEVRGPYAGGDPVHEPIVRGIVQAHGGVLQTHEVPGTPGSAYVLEVPIGAGAGAVAQAVPGGAGQETQDGGQSTGGRRRRGRRSSVNSFLENGAELPPGGAAAADERAVADGVPAEVAEGVQVPTGRRRRRAAGDAADGHGGREQLPRRGGRPAGQQALPAAASDRADGAEGPDGPGGSDGAGASGGTGRRRRRAAGAAEGSGGGAAAEQGDQGVGTDAGHAGERGGESDSAGYGALVAAGEQAPGTGMPHGLGATVPPQGMAMPGAGAPTGRRARRDPASALPALPSGGAEEPVAGSGAEQAGRPGGRRARRALAAARERAAQQESGERTPFALPPAEADRTPGSPDHARELTGEVAWSPGSGDRAAVRDDGADPAAWGGPAGVGPSGVDPAGVGPSGVDPAGVGPAGVGEQGVGRPDLGQSDSGQSALGQPGVAGGPQGGSGRAEIPGQVAYQDQPGGLPGPSQQVPYGDGSGRAGQTAPAPGAVAPDAGPGAAGPVPQPAPADPRVAQHGGGRPEASQRPGGPVAAGVTESQIPHQVQDPRALQPQAAVPGDVPGDAAQPNAVQPVAASGVDPRSVAYPQQQPGAQPGPQLGPQAAHQAAPQAPHAAGQGLQPQLQDGGDDFEAAHRDAAEQAARHDLAPGGPAADHTPPQSHPVQQPTGRRRAPAPDQPMSDGAGAPAALPPEQPVAGDQPVAGPGAPGEPRERIAQPLPAEAGTDGRGAPAPASDDPNSTQGRAIRVRTLGQGVPFAQHVADQQRRPQAQPFPSAAQPQPQPLPGAPATGQLGVQDQGQAQGQGQDAVAPGSPTGQDATGQTRTGGGQPASGSGRRRRLSTPGEAERHAGSGQGVPEQAPHQVPHQAQPSAPVASPPSGPQSAQGAPGQPVQQPQGRAYAIGAPDAGVEGPEPLDGPNGAVEVANRPQPQPMDDELPPEPLDNPRRLLVWPAPDVSTQQALSDRGYRPVIVNSRDEVDAQIAAFPAALFVDPLTGPITRTALQSLRQAAVAAEVPVLVTAGLGQATREAAYGADPAVLLKALAPRDSEQHPSRVLLIEEHPEIALALTTSLERRGMQVAQAADDAEAVDLATRMHPNLVVMDLMQVRRRRAGIVDWLRANGRLNRTPLVVYTAAVDQAELPRLASGETVLFLAERSTSAEVQSRIVDLLAKIGTN